MELFITSDSYWEARIDKALNTLSETGYKRYFEQQNYGASLNSVTVILMCQDPKLNLKRRIRFARKEKTIYLDIMLNLDQFLRINQRQREEIIINKLVAEIPAIIRKYNLTDFDLDKFEKDLKIWMNKIFEKEN